MPCFEDLFRESKGQPIQFNGHVVVLYDEFGISGGQRLKVVIESVNSNWRQGILLSLDGRFEVHSKSIKKSIVLWHDTAPREVEMRVWANQGPCMIKNVWDTGDGVMDSWHNGAAMMVEETKKGRRYRCNDGYPDEDFDDIVFRVEFT